MPIYEYQCQKCGERVEVIQKFSDAPLTECAACAGEMQKILSTSAFHLKGGGWYKTDYAPSTGSGSPSGSPSGSSGSGSSGSDSSGSGSSGSSGSSSHSSGCCSGGSCGS